MCASGELWLARARNDLQRAYARSRDLCFCQPLAGSLQFVGAHVMTPEGVQLHSGPNPKVDRSAGNNGYVVRLPVLAIEEILAAHVYRESAVQAFAHTRAESSHTAVLQPVITQLLTHQLRVG